MCADKSVDLDMHFRKRLGAGLFGGEGFILQRLTGPGRARAGRGLQVGQSTQGLLLASHHVQRDFVLAKHRAAQCFPWRKIQFCP